MTDPFKTSKFKSLQKKWYKKLDKEGFEDIETADGGLKAPTHPRTIAYAMKDKEEREAYYSIARDFLNSYKFSDDTEQSIWELHCEGIGYKTIAKQLGVKARRLYDILVRLQKLARLKK